MQHAFLAMRVRLESRTWTQHWTRYMLQLRQSKERARNCDERDCKKKKKLKAEREELRAWRLKQNGRQI